MRFGILAVAVVLLAGCASPASRQAGSGEPSRAGQQSAAHQPTTLQAIMKVEPASLAARPVVATGISIAFAQRLFNATLDITDGQERSHPYLAEALPQLNTDSWKVSPDGRMETTWRLRPNITWQDGTALTANDFVFAWKVYSTPDLGQSSSPPFAQMDEVIAQDDRTVVIRWKTPYPDAASMNGEYQALPMHLLQSAFEQDDAAAFSNEPFWASQYIGLGPYKLDRWEPGAEIQAVAFDGHVLGRPKIDRIVIHFVPDENTALTNLLSGDVQWATDRTIRYEQAKVLKERWGTTGGTPILTPAQPRFLEIQVRPDLANPRVLLTVKGRQALASAMDRDALNQGLFEGQGVPSETMITQYYPYFKQVDGAITKFPFDPARVAQLFGEEGYAKGPDGFLSSAGDHLTIPFLQEAGDQTQREMSIITDTWRRVGIDSQVSVMASSQLRDYRVRATFPGVYSTATSAAVEGGTKNLQNFVSSQIGTVDRGWRGSNYGGWSNAEYDRLYSAFSTTLEPSERAQQVTQMAKIISDDVPFIMMFFNFNVSAHSAALTGPDPNAFDTLVDWNVYEWQMKE